MLSCWCHTDKWTENTAKRWPIELCIFINFTFCGKAMERASHPTMSMMVWPYHALSSPTFWSSAPCPGPPTSPLENPASMPVCISSLFPLHFPSSISLRQLLNIINYNESTGIRMSTRPGWAGSSLLTWRIFNEVAALFTHNRVVTLQFPWN